MRVLLTESEAGASAQAERELLAAGYEVVRCVPAADADDRCVVFSESGPCPLNVVDVDVVVDVRSRFEPATARELGTTCAVRRGVPLVVAGPADSSVFPWSEAAATCAESGVVGACDAVLAPVEGKVARDVARVARQALGANAVEGGVVVSIARIAGDTGVFVTVLARLPVRVAQEIAEAVRLAVTGRKDFPERPLVVISEVR